MKKLLILALMIMLVPAAAMAMKDMENGKMDMDHGKMDMDHGKMGMEGVVMLQDEVVDGVKGSAHLMDMEGGMGQMLMVMFTDAKSGEMITTGAVALKIESPDEKTGAAQKMTKSKGMFGADVKFEQQGMHHFMVGTKLADGKKRTFHFHYEN